VKSSRWGLCLAALLLALLGNVGAQTAPPAVAADLSGTSWQLVKFQGSNDKTLTPADRAKYTIMFDDDGSVSVRIDCNRGHATWKSTGPNQLQFGPLALTRAMCPPAPLNDRIPKDWTYVSSYVLKNDHLFLSLMAGGGVYEFEPARAVGAAAGQPKRSSVRNPSASLENTYWKLTHLREAAVRLESQQQEPYFVLNPESHRVSGSGGCNGLTGRYELKGDELTFRQMASTMMACPKGMDAEAAFLKALTEAKTWKIAGQQLELLDARRNILASFEARSVK
jgi:heat shock protein HslJ